MKRLSRWAEALEELLERLLDVPFVRGQPGLATPNAPERKEQEQGLVRRADPAALPYLELSKFLEQALTGHRRCQDSQLADSVVIGVRVSRSAPPSAAGLSRPFAHTL